MVERRGDRGCDRHVAPAVPACRGHSRGRVRGRASGVPRVAARRDGHPRVGQGGRADPGRNAARAAARADRRGGDRRHADRTAVRAGRLGGPREAPNVDRHVVPGAAGHRVDQPVDRHGEGRHADLGVADHAGLGRARRAGQSDHRDGRRGGGWRGQPDHRDQRDHFSGRDVGRRAGPVERPGADPGGAFRTALARTRCAAGTTLRARPVQPAPRPAWGAGARRQGRAPACDVVLTGWRATWTTTATRHRVISSA
ncbi:hypothetical protein EV685_1259 [Sphaerotilus mobilis]|uniref:Uncharacterized protein n=1 Tax=Sphaerotilus mobilis TaxID=47994 RepID=A0A4Q7LPP3_9BURK|nr:hypothetical protein EV685_1259 [Sphaerotilus mobilis]